MNKKNILLAVVCICFITNSCEDTYQFTFQDPDFSIEIRVDDLVSRMTLEEKVSRMMNGSPAIERLGDYTSTEGRAIFNDASKKGSVEIFRGLTFWTPNIS